MSRVYCVKYMYSHIHMFNCFWFLFCSFKHSALKLHYHSLCNWRYNHITHWMTESNPRFMSVFVQMQYKVRSLKSSIDQWTHIKYLAIWTQLFCDNIDGVKRVIDGIKWHWPGHRDTDGVKGSLELQRGLRVIDWVKGHWKGHEDFDGVNGSFKQTQRNTPPTCCRWCLGHRTWRVSSFEKGSNPSVEQTRLITASRYALWQVLIQFGFGEAELGNVYRRTARRELFE